jgi:2-oxo-4-hydroxy-4-carboxy--5-ureidoimidazoline (OHCU) decarboxylase
MLNPTKSARVAGSHFVSPFDFDPDVEAPFESLGTDDVRAEIVKLAAAYDDAFGYMYLVSTAGLGGVDILDRLRLRLGSTAEAEETRTRTEMAIIIDNRLTRLPTDDAARSTR